MLYLTFQNVHLSFKNREGWGNGDFTGSLSAPLRCHRGDKSLEASLWSITFVSSFSLSFSPFSPPRITHFIHNLQPPSMGRFTIFGCHVTVSLLPCLHFSNKYFQVIGIIFGSLNFIIFLLLLTGSFVEQGIISDNCTTGVLDQKWCDTALGLLIGTVRQKNHLVWSIDDCRFAWRW